MKIKTIICEYNPMHTGHIYQIKKAKENNNDIIMCIMSGNFVQRGKFSVLDKYTKAQIAIENGADIVVELPTIFATSNAECFAKGAINQIKNIPNLTLNFGSECGDINKLQEIYKTIKSSSYDKILKENLKTGISYPKAHQNTLNYFDLNYSLKSNDILAIEYIGAINKLNKNINIETIKRIDNYNLDNINLKFISASSIRNSIKNKNIDEIKNYLPIQSYSALKNIETNYNKYIENFNTMIMHKIYDININELENIFDVNEGLENRIKNAIELSTNYNDFYENLKTKRYSESKLKRILLSTLLNITKQDFENAKNANGYLNILAIDKNKKDLLSYLSQYQNIITKFSDTEKLDKKTFEMYQKDLKAQKLYELITNQQTTKTTLFI